MQQRQLFQALCSRDLCSYNEDDSGLVISGDGRGGGSGRAERQWSGNVYAERGRPQRSRAPGSEAPTAAAGNKAAEKKRSLGDSDTNIQLQF